MQLRKRRRPQPIAALCLYCSGPLVRAQILCMLSPEEALRPCMEPLQFGTATVAFTFDCQLLLAGGRGRAMDVLTVPSATAAPGSRQRTWRCCELQHTKLHVHVKKSQAMCITGCSSACAHEQPGI